MLRWLTGDYAVGVEDVKAILDGEDLDGGEGPEDMAVMTRMSTKAAYITHNQTIQYLILLDDKRLRDDSPISSSQQLITYLIISSLSKASFLPIIHSATNPQ